MQSKHYAHLLGAAQLELAQTAPLFDLAKHLLDAAAGMDRLGVALVTGGATIDGGTTGAACVLRHVRCHTNPPEYGDRSLGVVVFVGSQGFLVGPGTIRRHRFGGQDFFLPFGGNLSGYNS